MTKRTRVESLIVGSSLIIMMAIVLAFPTKPHLIALAVNVIAAVLWMVVKKWQEC